MSTPNPIVPFYFGSGDKQLFGCYHRPNAERIRDCAVVICQPMGHEYIYCHRALRQLSTRLCNRGFPVLRFDFYGCGDSAGEGEDGTLAQWLQDVSSAISEAKTRAGVAHVCLIGVRLGAALALAAAAQRADVDSLVLWDPIVIGRAYLDELTSLQKQAITQRPRQSWAKSGLHTEVIGFPLPQQLRAELEQFELFEIVSSSQYPILTIDTSETHNAELKQYMSNYGVRFDYQEIQAPKIWQPTVDGNLIVPSQLLQTIVTWASKVYA